MGDECKEFYFAGWNMWEVRASGAESWAYAYLRNVGTQVVELGSNAPSPPFRSTPKKGREHLVNVMNQGVAAGMKVIRVWAHSITAGWEMQKSPGQYDEKVLQGMDFVMDEAAKRGLKLVRVLRRRPFPLVCSLLPCTYVDLGFRRQLVQGQRDR